MTAHDTNIESTVGTHLLADLRGISADLLQNESALESLLESSLIDNGYNILNLHVHKFEAGGFGVTGVALLSESHASFHSYPELGYLAFDLFSCGKNDPHNVLDQWIETLKPADISVASQNRG